MTTPPTKDITLYQNDTFEMTVVYEDSDGNAITNLNKAQLQIKATKGAAFSAALLVVNETSGITLTANQGRLAIKLTDEQTAGLTAPGSGYYDLVVETTGNDKYVLLQGEVTILQGVTTWQT